MESIIVLTSQYQYWSEITVTKFLKLWKNNKIEILIEQKDREIRGISITIKMPLIVRLLKFVGYKNYKNEVAYSPQAVYDRDKNICQYVHYDTFGKPFQYKCKAQEKSIDHVIPKYMGGPTSFENCVTSCRNCNVVIKRNRTPEQAGLRLIRMPVVPDFQRTGYIMRMEFRFNPENTAHRYYVDKILKTA